MRKLWGHERARRVLGETILHHRLAHAYLFHGPPQVGKRTVARAFAQFLLCERSRREPLLWEACGHCPSCRLFQAGGHPDFVQVQPSAGGRSGTSTVVRQEVIPIEAVRQLQREIQYRPARARGKVLVILRADTMAAETANSLLKILEEPPPETRFLLTAANRAAMLPTVLSRCVHLRFGLVAMATVAAFLQEEKGLAPDEAALVAGLAGGRLGRASQLADDPELGARRDRVTAMLLQLQQGPPTVALRLAEEMAPGREAGGSESEGEPGEAEAAPADSPLQQHLDLLQSLYRDALLSHWGRPGAWLQERAELGEWARSLAPAALLGGLRDIEDARRLLRRNANAQLVLEHLLLRLYWDQRPRAAA